MSAGDDTPFDIAKKAGTTLRVVRALAWRMTRPYALSADDVDDVVQTAMLHLVEASARGIPPFGRTLKIAILQSLDQRARQIDPTGLEIDDAEPGEMAARPELVTQPRDREAIALWQLQRTWPGLSDRHRTALRLWLLGHEFREIGVALGGSGDATALANRGSGGVFQALDKIKEVGRTKTAARLLGDARGRACKYCGASLPPATWTGRERLFCGGTHRQAFYRDQRSEAA